MYGCKSLLMGYLLAQGTLMKLIITFSRKSNNKPSTKKYTYYRNNKSIVVLGSSDITDCLRCKS